MHPNERLQIDHVARLQVANIPSDPKPPGAAKGVACCDLVNRGAAYADGKIFFNTLDGRTIALDAATGQPRWITQLADINKGETMTMAPLVVKGKVLVGNSAAPVTVLACFTYS